MVFSSRFRNSLRLIVSVSDRRIYFMKYIKKEGKKYLIDKIKDT